MTLPFHHPTGCRVERGQVLLLFVLFIVVLVLVVGLGIDVGYAYVTEARLAKAVDAACLAGVRSLGLGVAQAGNVARSTFAANYAGGSNNGGVTPTISFTTSSGNNLLVNVDATASINTLFVRLLPQWQTLNVHSSAQAIRTKLIMTLVLDRSGSMQSNGGAAALPPAVINFISNFSDDIDEVAVSSFALAATVDLPMTQPFKTQVQQVVQAMQFVGGTFAQGGLTNALVQNASVPIAPGQVAVKVVVFFTDGLANMVQDTLPCPPNTLLNFGGVDPPNTGVAFANPFTGAQTDFIGDNGTPGSCSGASQFYSQLNNIWEPFTRANVTADAQYRSLVTAEEMRAEGTLIYSVGLGSEPDEVFMKQIANADDPANPTFNPNEPVGEYLHAQQASDLNGIFQQIAQKILWRLTK